MADFNVLTLAITTLKADAEALIAKKAVEDPAIQQNIDAATQAVTDIDNEVKSNL